MKRNYFIAIMVTGLMTVATVAQAADVTFGGQFRPRFNIDNDASDGTKNSTYFDTRVRLNAKANVNANTEVFLQFQSVGIWGDSDTIYSEQRTATGSANEASEGVDDVGFHQAYLILKNLGGKSLDAKIGRQEVVIDGHRLFGHTGWTQGAETKDAFRLTHAAGNHSLNYTYIAGVENDDVSVADNAYDDYSVHVIHAQTQGVLGGALSGLFTITNDEQDSTTIGNQHDQQIWYTLGARQKGKLAGLDYRVEFYHQFGDAGRIGTDTGMGIAGASEDGQSVDRDAQMFGIRVGKTFKNAKASPTLTFWYDLLTGMDDDAVSEGDFGAFDTMFDTGHKFYGLQDFYLARNGAKSGYFGLQDIALKLKMSPRPGWTVKADLHHFRTATDISGGDADAILTNITDASTAINAAMEPDLGTELDLTLVNKYDANTTISAGYSHYWTTNTFGQLNCGTGGTGGTCGSNNNDGSDWMYVQIDTKF